MTATPRIVCLFVLGAALAWIASAGWAEQEQVRTQVTAQLPAPVAPSIDVTFSPLAPSNRDRVVFKAVPNNPASVRRIDFWLDAMKIGEASSPPWTLAAGPYPAGEHTIGAASYDAFGKQLAKKYTHLRIKESPLDLSFECSPARPTNRDALTIKAVMPFQSDIHSLVFYLDARKVAEDESYPWEFSGGPYPAKTYTLGAEAYDRDGHPIGRKYSSLMVRFFPVELYLSHSPSRPTSADRITFMAGASDRRDIAKVVFTVDAKIIGEDSVWPWRVTAGPFPRGTITYGVGIYDKEGRRQGFKYSGLRIE